MQELELHEKFEMEILDIMRRQTALDKLIFCGGTMLRLCFGLSRYSTDLDFYISHGKSYDKEFENLKTSFTKAGFEITDHQEKHFTFLIELRGKGYPRRLKIEIRKQCPKNILTMQNIAFSKNAPTLQVKMSTCTLEQMWQNKISAFLDRKEIRDAFDLEFILRRGGGKVEALDKGIIEELLKILNNFTTHDFRNVLGNLLNAEDKKFYIENKFTFLKGALQTRLS